MLGINQVYHEHTASYYVGESEAVSVQGRRRITLNFFFCTRSCGDRDYMNSMASKLRQGLGTSSSNEQVSSSRASSNDQYPAEESDLVESCCHCCSRFQ